jgi:hypothetical protein
MASHSYVCLGINELTEQLASTRKTADAAVAKARKEQGDIEEAMIQAKLQLAQLQSDNQVLQQQLKQSAKKVRHCCCCGSSLSRSLFLFFYVLCQGLFG